MFSTIKSKLALMVGLYIFILLIICGVSIYTTNKIQHELHQVTAEDIPLTKKITHVLEGQAETAIVLEQIMVSYLENDVIPIDKAEKFLALSEKEKGALQGTEQFLDQLIADYAGGAPEALLTLQPKMHQITQLFDQYFLQARHVLEVLENEGFAASKDELHKVEEDGGRLTRSLGEFLLAVELMTEDALLGVEAHEQQLLSTLIFLGVGSIVLGSLGGLLVARSILKPLGAEPHVLSRLSGRIAEGDLRLDSADTSGAVGVYHSIVQMRDNLRELVIDIDNASAQVLSNAEKSMAMNELSDDAIKGQHEETEMVATAVQEMSSTVQEIASSASQTADATQTLLDSTEAGTQTVNRAVDAMNALVEDINTTNQHITELKENASNIGSVLEVIKSIAEQTNLLALNAAIEAARAGEQGRGFAVVADEVRSLAQRTQASTAEINAMVGKIQSGTDTAVSAIQQSVSSMGGALSLVNDSGECLHDANTGMQHINDMNTQVATAAEEQSSVVEEVTRNIEAINQLTFETSNASNSSKEAVTNLVAVANQLVEKVHRFNVGKSA